MKRICLYGASSDKLAQEYFAGAYAVGKALAENGIGLVFGGGATGLMGAACRGARDGGGEIIGIAPKFFDEEGVLFQECTELIFTETMRERKQKMEDLADGFIVVPGGIGTLEEFFEIFTLRQLDRHNKPIAILNTRGYYDQMIAFLRHMVEEGFMGSHCLDLFAVFDDAEELITYMKEKLEV